MRFAPVLIAASIALLSAHGASAVTIPVGFDLQIAVSDDLGGSLGSADIAGLNGAGMIAMSENAEADTATFSLNGPASQSGWTVTSWDSTVKYDPFITNNFVVENNTGGTATYTISVSSVIPAFNASQIIQSTMDISLLDDDNAGGASAASVTGTAVYEAFVNAGSALTLLDDPFSLSCANPFDCAANGDDFDGVLSQGFGPIVATSIGITVTFTLSDGDSAAVQSRFEIVPEPSTALLVGAGLLAVAARRRRA